MIALAAPKTPPPHSRRIFDSRAMLTLCHGRIAGEAYVPLS